MRSTRVFRFGLGLLMAILLVAAAAPTAGAGSVAARPASDLVTGCTGEYFNNPSLAGAPVFTRSDPAINFFWPEGTSPGYGLNASYYSVRWTCTINVPVAGTYTFTMVADDGMNLIVDGTLLIWAWYDQGPSYYSNPIYLNAGTHGVRVEYYNATNGGTAQVSSNISGSASYYPPSTGNYYPPSTGAYYPPANTAPYYQGYVAGGILSNCNGEYFNNPGLWGAPAFVRTDPGINFYWTAGTSPGPGLNATYYSVRWTCTINVPAAATYTFNMLTDDGMNLVVDNNVLILAWRDQSPTPYTRAVYLNAGLHTVRVDYYNATLNGVAQVSMR